MVCRTENGVWVEIWTVKKICVLLNWSLGCQQCSCGKAWHTRLIGFWKITIVYQLKVVIICSVVCIILQNTARILWPLRIAGGKRWCRQQFVCVGGDYFKIGYQPGFLELWRRGVIRAVHQQYNVVCFALKTLNPQVIFLQVAIRLKKFGIWYSLGWIGKQ